MKVLPPANDSSAIFPTVACSSSPMRVSAKVFSEQARTRGQVGGRRWCGRLYCLSGLSALHGDWRGLLGFERKRRLPAFFCSSQKSLAVGLPMGQLLFGLEHPKLFFLLLPLIFYHMLQLLVGAILLGRWQDDESATFRSEDSL